MHKAAVKYISGLSKNAFKRPETFFNRSLILNALPGVISAACTGVTGEHHVTHAFCRSGKIGFGESALCPLDPASSLYVFTIAASHTVVNKYYGFTARAFH